MSNYGSILSNTDKTTPIDPNITSPETTKSSYGSGTSNGMGNVKSYASYTRQQVDIDRCMAEHFDGSTRLIGAPHQFLSHNDNRYGNSEMGRMYAEKIIMEAPIVYIKPGVSEFLPELNSNERTGFAKALAAYHGGDKTALLDKLNGDGDDIIQYFGIKPDYSGYMSKVNMLCRMLATFLDIQDLKVPWAKGGTTFATYDWRYYNMSAEYGDLDFEEPASGFFDFVGNLFGSLNSSITTDYEYIQFYVTPDSSYSQSFSNQTTSSVLENLSDQLEGVAKELQVISSMSGGDIGNLANSAASSLSDYIQENAGGNGPIFTMLRRITGASKQVINGGNFILPEIWDRSNSDASFSFSIHLTTPYGNKLAWYINVGVPMMFAIALALPIQQTANVVASPYLLKCFSPGWFTSSMCIVDSLSIEKASDGTWNSANLPNDVTIRISIKDLYSQLAIPNTNSIGEFMANTGMLEFLMTTAGVDISKQEISDKWEVWKALFENKFHSFIQDNAYDAWLAFKHGAQNIFKILK